MKRIVEFPLESGGSILVEVDEPTPTDDRISLSDDMVQAAQQTFESAIGTVKTVAGAIINQVQSLKQPPEEVEVKFGLKMSAKLEAFIASGNGEANYEITLKWKGNPKDDHTV